MKETIYGWYPAARDVWKHYADDKVNSYDREFLFKYGKTGFSSANTTSRSDLNAAVSRSATERSSKTFSELLPNSPDNVKSPCQPKDDVDRLNSTSQTDELRSSRPHLARSSSLRTPAKKWASRVAETDFTPAQSIHRPFGGGSVENQATPACQVTVQPIPTSNLQPQPPPSSSARKRAQSAVITSAGQYRSTPLPPRPTKSAVPFENTSLTCRQIQPPQSPASGDVVLRPSAADAGVCAARQPVPPSQPAKPDVRQRPATAHVTGREELGVDNPLDYYEQLKKHGWKMEIPGDPLNLKRPCIAKRHPVYVQVEIPTIPPPAPIGRIDSTETFFYNTIPRHRMTFTIHPDWPSEILHARRMELQKRHGDRFTYRSHDFAFVY